MLNMYVVYMLTLYCSANFRNVSAQGGGGGLLKPPPVTLEPFEFLGK